MKSSTSGSVKFVWMSLDLPTRSLERMKIVSETNVDLHTRWTKTTQLKILWCIFSLVREKIYYWPAKNWFLVWFSWLIRRVLSSTSDPTEWDDLNLIALSSPWPKTMAPAHAAKANQAWWPLNFPEINYCGHSLEHNGWMKFWIKIELLAWDHESSKNDGSNKPGRKSRSPRYITYPTPWRKKEGMLDSDFPNICAR